MENIRDDSSYLILRLLLYANATPSLMNHVSLTFSSLSAITTDDEHRIQMGNIIAVSMN